MRHPSALGLSILAAVALATPAMAGETLGQTIDQKTDQVKDKAGQVGTTLKDKTANAKTAVKDSWLTARTKIALFADKRVSGTRVSVDTVGGTVTLRGKVDSPEAKAAAASIASGIDGVKAVRNELQVVPPDARKVVNASDKAITAAVEARLKDDGRLKKVDVRSDAGVVVLTGEVPSLAASARASELAREVPGVHAVTNDLTYARSSFLQPGEPIRVVDVGLVP